MLAQRTQLRAQGVVLAGQRDDAAAQCRGILAQLFQRRQHLGVAAGDLLLVRFLEVHLGRFRLRCARLALGLAHALGGLLQLVLATGGGGALLFFRQVGHGGGGADRDHAGLDRFHHLRGGLGVDALDHADLTGAQLGFARQLGAADLRCRFPRRTVFTGLIGDVGGAIALALQLRLLDLLAGGQDVALAQRQHAALEVGHAAAAQMLFDHPQVHVFHALEAGVLHGIEGQAMLLADAETVMAIDQYIPPQHQRIAAAFGQDAALQRVMFVRGQRVDVGLEFFFDDDIHGHGSEQERNRPLYPLATIGPAQAVARIISPRVPVIWSICALSTISGGDSAMMSPVQRTSSRPSWKQRR